MNSLELEQEEERDDWTSDNDHNNHISLNIVLDK